ncbi:hypothetical protein Tco_1125083 [Tanacetum coccineum]|uniref:Uncharacterized protein n=1 Tax=Tanacetum coccineum TaxID=301880 RepID=A0ABQ5JAT8_9ASTR
MQDCKSISTPLPTDVKLSSNMSPSNEKERMEMSQVSYASAVGSLMFTMICTRPNIAHVVGVVSRYMAEPVHLDRSKSTTGYVFTLSGGTVSWVSKLQSVVAMLTTEAVKWNPALSIPKIKHIQVQYHFVHEKVEEGTVDMQKIHTDDNVTNYLTKAINVIMESLVKKKQKGAILELKRRHLKNTIFCTYTPYPAMKIRRISANSAQEMRNDQFLIRCIHYNQYVVCTAVHQSKIHI